MGNDEFEKMTDTAFCQTEAVMGTDAYQANVEFSKAQTELVRAQIRSAQEQEARHNMKQSAVSVLALTVTVMVLPLYVLLLVWLFGEVF